MKLNRRIFLTSLSLLPFRRSEAKEGQPLSTEQRSVEEFGAKGDGQHDDTEAIQRALSSSGVIRFSPGKTYLVYARTKDILRVVQGNTHLVGDEKNPPTLVYRDADPTLVDDIAFLNVSSSSVIENVSVVGIHFLCARKRARLTPRPLIFVQNVRGFTFQGNIVENSSYGIFLRNVSDFRVTRNHILRSLADGIQASNQGSQTTGSSLCRGEISYNHLEFNGDDCIAIGSQVTGEPKLLPSEIVVCNNFCEKQGPRGGGIGIYGSRDIRLANNIIVGASKHGIAIVADTNNRQDTNKRVLVDGNVIIDVPRADYNSDKYYNCAILVGNRNSGGDAGYLSDAFADDIQIQHNTVYCRDRNGIVVSIGERFRERAYLAPSSILVRDNVLTNVADRGVLVSAFTVVGTGDVKFSDNYVSGYRS